MADPSFSTPQGRAPTYDFAKFSRKLHDIERIGAPGGGGCAPLGPPRSATVVVHYVLMNDIRSIVIHNFIKNFPESHE